MAMCRIPMATVQTLKDKNNDTFYPVTKTEAVYNADGSETLDTTINNFSNVVQNLSDTKATISTSAGDANKMMKADGTKALVGSDNIDFTTLACTIGSNFSPVVNRVLVSGRTVKVTLLLQCTTAASSDVVLATLPSSLVGKLDTASTISNHRPVTFFNGGTQYGCTTPTHGYLTVSGGFGMWGATQSNFYLINEVFIFID